MPIDADDENEEEDKNIEVGDAFKFKYRVRYTTAHEYSVDADLVYCSDNYLMTRCKPESVVSERGFSCLGPTDTGLWGGVEIYPLCYPIFNSCERSSGEAKLIRPWTFWLKPTNA